MGEGNDGWARVVVGKREWRKVGEGDREWARVLGGLVRVVVGQ